MSESKLISVETICIHYNIDQSFIRDLNSIGLLEVSVVEQTHFVYQEQIKDLEKIIRLHRELELNLEAIDVIFNLLEKEQSLREELKMLKNRLRLYENE